jgi:hypothetical protein
LEDFLSSLLRVLLERSGKFSKFVTQGSLVDEDRIFGPSAGFVWVHTTHNTHTHTHTHKTLVGSPKSSFKDFVGHFVPHTQSPECFTRKVPVIGKRQTESSGMGNSSLIFLL